jgi:hypothetical protein
MIKMSEIGLAGEFETKGQVVRTGKYSGLHKRESTGEITPIGSRSGLSLAHEAHDRAHDEAPNLFMFYGQAVTRTGD